MFAIRAMVARGFSCFSGGFSFYSFQIAHLARPLPPNRRCRLNGRHTQAKAVMVKLWMLCRLGPHVAGVCPSYALYCLTLFMHYK